MTSNNVSRLMLSHTTDWDQTVAPYPEAARLFLCLGATDDEVTRAMAIAASRGCVRVVRVLLDHDGCIDYDNVMASAAREGHLEIVQLMLNHGATDYDSTTLSAACGGHHDIIRLMMNHNVDQVCLDNSLIIAACKGHLEVVQLVLTTRTTPEVISAAMDVAAAEGHHKVVHTLSR